MDSVISETLVSCINGLIIGTRFYSVYSALLISTNISLNLSSSLTPALSSKDTLLTLTKTSLKRQLVRPPAGTTQSPLLNSSAAFLNSPLSSSGMASMTPKNSSDSYWKDYQKT